MTDETPEIDIHTYAARRDDGVTVDVRERGEYVDGHVPGARLHADGPAGRPRSASSTAAPRST